MHKGIKQHIGFLAFIVLLSACMEPSLPNIGPYRPLAEIVKASGSVKDPNVVKEGISGEVRVWGYLDHSNILPKQSLFNLNRVRNEGTGKGAHVKLTGKKRKYAELFKTLQSLEEVPTKILVKGKLKTFKMYFNFSSATGLYIEVSDPKDIKILKPQQEEK